MADFLYHLIFHPNRSLECSSGHRQSSYFAFGDGTLFSHCVLVTEILLSFLKNEYLKIHKHAVRINPQFIQIIKYKMFFFFFFYLLQSRLEAPALLSSIKYLQVLEL